MMPTWTVYIGMDGKVYAYDPIEEFPTRDVQRVVGEVTTATAEDAIRYAEEVLL